MRTDGFELPNGSLHNAVAVIFVVRPQRGRIDLGYFVGSRRAATES